MKKTLFFLVTLALVGFSACSDDDDNVSLPDITVNFANTEIGLSEDSVSRDVVINLSRKADVAVAVAVSLTASTGLEYGTDFKTTPEAVDNNIKVTIPAGSTSEKFSISRIEKAIFDGSENVKFKIASISTSTGIQIGDKNETTITFGTIVSKGDQITLEGKTAASVYGNSVYVDFSTNSQVAVNRKNWNLGFSNGTDFRVVLNSADATTAVSSGKTDINAVTLADANAAQEIGGTAYMTPAGLPLSVVDAINGDLAGSVFASVSANSADNLVYFVAPEDNKKSRDLWYKVKVNRSGNGGYSVEYAKVGDTEITTVEVAKNAAYNLSFLSFADKKTVTVEPESKKWDIMWGFNTGLRAPDLKSTYFLQDYVAINTLAGAQAVEVLTTTSTFADYSKANISTSTFSSDKDVIGDKWRSTSAYGGGTLGIKTDRFYVVKDPEGQYYKLRFLKMGLGNDGGERGRPVVEYELLN